MSQSLPRVSGYYLGVASNTSGTSVDTFIIYILDTLIMIIIIHILLYVF